jgi:hypothetical protein
MLQLIAEIVEFKGRWESLKSRRINTKSGRIPVFIGRRDVGITVVRRVFGARTR